MFRAIGIGQSSSAQVGVAGSVAAGNIGELSTTGAANQAAFEQQAGQARGAQVGAITGAAAEIVANRNRNNAAA